LQPHDSPTAPHEVDVVVVEDHSPAGGYHDTVVGRGRGQHLALQATEFLLALFTPQLGDRRVRHPRHHLIRVDEVRPHPTPHSAADRALPRAHHPHEPEHQKAAKRARYRSAAATTSSMVSPPNFRIASSAST